MADTRAMGRTVSHGIALMLVVTVPATAGLLALSIEIVKVLFERGRFLPADPGRAAATNGGSHPGLGESTRSGVSLFGRLRLGARLERRGCLLK